MILYLSSEEEEKVLKRALKKWIVFSGSAKDIDYAEKIYHRILKYSNSKKKKEEKKDENIF